MQVHRCSTQERAGGGRARGRLSGRSFCHGSSESSQPHSPPLRYHLLLLLMSSAVSLAAAAADAVLSCLRLRVGETAFFSYFFFFFPKTHAMSFTAS